MNELTLIAGKSIIKLFFMFMVGFVSAKAGLLTKEVNKGLTDILVYVFTPFSIVSGFFVDYSSELLKGMLWSLLICLVGYAIAIVLGCIIAPSRVPTCDVDKVAIAFANTGYVGLPVITMMLGQVGIIYLAMHRITYQFLFYTYATMVLGKNFKLSDIKKAILSAPIISAFIGLAVFCSKLVLPDIISAPISSIGNCAGPVGLIICGGIVARSDLKSILSSPRIILIAFIKNLLLPLCCMAVAIALKMPETVIIVAIVTIGCPTGSMVPIFAEKYNNHPEYASGIFCLSTLACMFTIPALIAIYSLF